MPGNQWLTNEAQPIGAGWGGPPQLSAPNISGLVEAILRNKLARDKMTQENIADTIKNVRQERQSAQYIEAMKQAGLIPKDYDAGGLMGAKLGEGIAERIQAQQRIDLEGEQQDYMKPYYEAKTWETYNPQYAPRSGGTPRYPYKIPGTDETVELPASDYARRKAEDVTTGSYQGLLENETNARAKIQELETKWGGATKGQLKGAPAWSWQKDKTKAERIKDQILYNRAVQALQQNQTQRENLEKRKPGLVGAAPAPTDADTGDTDTGDTGGGTAPPQGGEGGPNKPVTRGEKIDQATVAQYIKAAGGDPAAARRMAQEDGWTF